MLPERQEKSFFAECVSFSLNRNFFLQNILKQKYSNSFILIFNVILKKIDIYKINVCLSL